ncbi:hypothetical protein OGAPHI_005513 [Ogataea philodendri]|uniref:Sister chromatid cohesion protein DCC1 n=1 Tax=Ogataea philodendri TaxID=1378263 RepID=A0A9P8P072_9ASCO|nr:uncharacterized protein OGAPHI_005513 [Ogataea philodendri]KAH3662264.1 hypothetical protein OGAPHI_005513 [Ogataea philodendri]
MDLYSVIGPTPQITPSSSLRLVELGPEVLQAIENKSELYLKSAGSDDYPVLVTPSKTFKIRQKSHSNCVLLIQNQGETGFAYSQFNNELLLSSIEPSVNIKGVSVLKHLSQKPEQKPISLETIYENSPISKNEFEQLRPELNLVDLEGSCYIMHDELVCDCLSTILRSTIEELVDSGDEMHIMTRLQSIDADWVIQAVQKHQEEQFPREIRDTVLAKYTTRTGSSLSFRNEKIVRLYGVLLLKNSPADTKLDDFTLNLRLNMPSNYHPDIKLEYLNGNYIEENGCIRYFAETDLSPIPAERISELFKLKKEWKLGEIEPFVQRINTKNLKTEKFLIKFAKVRRSGKNIIVTGR